jgi:hypothetical protein
LHEVVNVNIDEDSGKRVARRPIFFEKNCWMATKYKKTCAPHRRGNAPAVRFGRNEAGCKLSRFGGQDKGLAGFNAKRPVNDSRLYLQEMDF